MTRTILIVVAVVLISAATASAGAFIVTSKHIKNGTIQTVDISAKARATLRGQRGPAGPRGLAGAQGAPGSQGAQGPQGAAGAQGPQGAQGAQGVTAVQYVEVESATSPAFAACPAGKFVIGGGGTANGATNVLFASAPVAVDTWGAAAVPEDEPVAAFAICAVLSAPPAASPAALSAARAVLEGK